MEQRMNDDGVTLRDYFAAHCPITIDDALDIAIEAGRDGEGGFSGLLKFYAELRMQYADTMLAARGEK